MTWFASIWPYARPRPGRRLHQRRSTVDLPRPDHRPFGLYPPPPRGGLRLDGLFALALLIAYVAILVGAMRAYAPPIPNPSDLPPGDARWLVPVNEMPADDDSPEPPLTEKGVR